MSGNTVRLHRVLATKPEKVFRANAGDVTNAFEF